MKFAVLSDLHGNLTALDAVLRRVSDFKLDGIMLLGDLIDYGPHSNEVIEAIRALSGNVVCNLWGNHEMAILRNKFERFSSQRGVDSAKYTASKLSEESKSYIETNMRESAVLEFSVSGKKCLAVHGSLQDAYWKSIFPTDALEEYEKYDYVFSGHSHLPHYFERYYKTDNPKLRNKKKTVFINPGSVGQPRNQNNNAQFAVIDFDTEEVIFPKVKYDIVSEQKSFSEEVDAFYKERLTEGV